MVLALPKGPELSKNSIATCILSQTQTMCRAQYTEPGMLDTGGLAGSSSPVVPLVRGSNPGVVGSPLPVQKRRLGNKKNWIVFQSLIRFGSDLFRDRTHSIGIFRDYRLPLAK